MIWPHPVAAAARAADGSSSFHIDLGDLPTWLLALFALLALAAAWLAYREQRKASVALGTQAESQRQAFEDQRAANAIQADVLRAQLADLMRQARSVARMQADLVTLKLRGWALAVPGLRDNPGPSVHEAVVENESSQPIRNVACYIQAAQDRPLDPPSRIGRLSALGISPMTGQHQEVFTDEPGPVDQTKIGLLQPGNKAAFIFPYEVANAEVVFTLRFTDDAGLHWQRDNDLNLEQIPERDW